MRALLDTNILIHREAPIISRQNIGLLFNWLDRLRYEKCVHPISILEIEQYKDERLRRSFATKLASYRLIRAPAPISTEVQTLSDAVDSTENDLNDTKILNELYAERIELLITEDRGIARKADRLGIGDRVFTIDGFLEKVVAENPELIEYKVLSVKKSLFANLNVADPFFDSLRKEYPNFDRWFNHKSEDPAYVCFRERDSLVAFLYLKLEYEREPYHDIVPPFLPKRRLKVGSFKVEFNGFKLGERFLKIIFDNALKQRVEEIYITTFKHSAEQERLIKLLEDFGFSLHGQRRNPYGNENVYVRDMNLQFNATEPRLSFPFVSRSSRSFLVPIYPEYHTELLPDSILKTESPTNYVEQQPHRNSIRKVYVSRSYFRDLVPGDVIVFYRTGGYHQSVVTTLGVVENVYVNIQSEEQFIRLCRKRSVFTDEELRAHWRFRTNSRPFIVNFLYSYSFPKRPNMASLIEHGVLHDIYSAPRGFKRITSEQFETILRLSESDARFIVD